MSALQPWICKALTDEVWSSLRRVQIYTVTDFVGRDREDIAQASGVSYKVILLLRKGFCVGHRNTNRTEVDLDHMRTNLSSSSSTTIQLSSGFHDKCSQDKCLRDICSQDK